MSLVATRMLAARAVSDMDKNTNLLGNYGALNMMKNDTEDMNSIITPQLQAAAMGSAGRTLQTPVLEGHAVITNTRSVTIPMNLGTSQMVTITFTVYEFGFGIARDVFSNNELAMNQYFAKQMKQGAVLLGQQMDTAATTAINTARTQVADGLGLYTFNTTNHEMTSSSANFPNLLTALPSIMSKNKFNMGGRLNVLGNLNLRGEVDTYIQYGQANNRNQVATLADKDFYYSDNVSNNTGNRMTGFACQKGDTGLLFRLARPALRNARTSDGHEFGTMRLPYLDIPVDTYSYSKVADVSAQEPDLTRAPVEYFSFATEVAYLTAWNPDQANDPSGILRFAGTTA